PVVLAGPVRLRVSSQPLLVMEEVRIGAAPDGSGGFLAGARVARLEIRAGLWSSLAARWPQLEHFAGDAIELQVAARADEAPPLVLVIDRAEGRALAAGPTELRASGVFEGHPYRLRLEGGPLAALAQADAPWPLELFAEGLDASLVVAGSLEAAGPTGERSLAGRFDFGVGAPDAQALARLLEADLPAIGPSAMAGRVRFAPGRIELRELVGTAGESRFGGELDVALNGGRPRVDGRLGAAVLDMRPFLGQGDRNEAAPPPRTLFDWYRGLDDARLPLAGLGVVDGRIAMAID